MNLLQLIQEKTHRFNGTSHQAGLEAVIHHIEIAEKHLLRARQESNEFLYTDVIYRTNHAYEGILKEAYAILTSSQDPPSKSLHQIEKYLETNNILRERVAALLTNYRVEWRNPSTHNHQLFFSEQEAFLAIVSICAFINILLDQLLEKAAFDREDEEIKKSGEKPTANIKGYESLELLDRVVELIKKYSSKFPQPMDPSWGWSEIERLGGLAAFIQFSDKKIKIMREVTIQTGEKRFRPDMVLERGHEKIILEVKRASKYPVSSVAEEQLFSYLSAAKIDVGIIYFAPDEPVAELAQTVVEKNIGKITQKAISLYPKKS